MKKHHFARLSKETIFNVVSSPCRNKTGATIFQTADRYKAYDFLDTYISMHPSHITYIVAKTYSVNIISVAKD